MAVRHFTAASSEFITFSPGSVADMDGGPITMACVWRATTVHAGSLIYAVKDTNLLNWSMNPFSDGHVWANCNVSSGGVLPYLAANWYLTAFTKAEGSQAWRKHQLNLTTPAGWTHANGNVSPDSVNVPVTRIEVGRNRFGSEFLNGDLALVGVWDTALSDPAVEALNAADGVRTWVNAAPRILLPFYQPNVGENIKCLMGSGVNQTARTGTTVVGGQDPPGFGLTLIPGSNIHMTDNMASALRKTYPALNEQGVSALLQKWKLDNGKTDWDAYVLDCFGFCSFFGQPQNHFMDAQDRTWALRDFFA